MSTNVLKVKPVGFFPDASFANILVSLVSLAEKYTIISILEMKNILSLEFHVINLTKLTKRLAKLSFGKNPNV